MVEAEPMSHADAETLLGMEIPNPSGKPQGFLVRKDSTYKWVSKSDFEGKIFHSDIDKFTTLQALFEEWNDFFKNYTKCKAKTQTKGRKLRMPIERRQQVSLVSKHLTLISKTLSKILTSFSN